MQSRALELMVGMFFCLGVAAIFILTFRVASLESSGARGGYRVTADFENIGGLRSGASVTIAGVRIGRVREIVIEPTTFNARATLEIGTEFSNIPADSSAKILTAGVLGEKYIGLEPGADDAVLKDGGRIVHTQSAVVLENIIGQFLANKASGSAGSKKE